MRMHAQGSLPVIPILLSPEFVIRGKGSYTFVHFMSLTKAALYHETMKTTASTTSTDHVNTTFNGASSQAMKVADCEPLLGGYAAWLQAKDLIEQEKTAVGAPVHVDSP
jgi:hypothetical protein